jgi:3-hydroxyisobutyrate dehydrogenase-like beta-hydroxyacid dehydrogenase
MASSTLSVACIGLGRMGSGIAHNIQRSGFQLTVYNRTREKTAPFAAAGAKVANTPREAAAAAEFVITNLMDDASVIATMDGNDGILAGMRPGAIHIGTTTLSPSASTRLAELHAAQGSYYVSAPVAGRPDAAQAGQLYTFVAGTESAVERCQPVFKAYARQIMPAGEDPAMAMSMKLTGNFFVAGLLELMGEAFVFAEKRGVGSDFVRYMLKAFMPLSGEYVDRIGDRSFSSAGFTVDAGLKDVRLILDAAAEVGAPLPTASLVRDRCIAAQAHGMAQYDWSCLTEIVRLDAGQSLTKAAE